VSNFWWEWIGLELELVAIDGGGEGGREEERESYLHIMHHFSVTTLVLQKGYYKKRKIFLLNKYN
jgi:hypothetical protein